MDTAQVLGREYRPRVLDTALQTALAATGAVVIEGARASGKTMTALHAAASYVFIDDAEVQRLLEVAPGSLLEGEPPRLLDEWQVAPQLWNLVRRAVDATAEPGRFILTGSAVPPDDVTRHTGAGRFLRLRQRTMCWWEKLDNPPGAVSLAGIASYGRVNVFGFVETPYRKVVEGVVTDDVDYLTADEEDRFVIAQANAPLTEDLRFAESRVLSAAVAARSTTSPATTSTTWTSRRARWCRSRPR